MTKSISILFVFLLSGFAVSAGGGWTQPHKGGYFKLNQSALMANRFYAPDGGLIDITTIGWYATSLYGEYGLTDRLTIVAFVPFFARNTLNEIRFEPSERTLPGDELNAFGDVDLQVQYGIYQSEVWVVSARILLGIPSGKTGGGSSGILQTGDGEFNQMLRMDVSRPMGKKLWSSVYAGYNRRTRGFSDEWRYGLELGLKFGKRAYVLGRVDAVHSTFNGSDFQPEGNTLFANNIEYISPAVEIGIENPDGFGLSASVAGAFSGRNVLAAPVYSLGIYFRLKGKS